MVPSAENKIQNRGGRKRVGSSYFQLYFQVRRNFSSERLQNKEHITHVHSVLRSYQSHFQVFQKQGTKHGELQIVQKSSTFLKQCWKTVENSAQERFGSE